jgi:hypothetical protein
MPSDGADLECSISHHNLSEIPNYYALSYTWGPESPSSFITVNSSHFEVRENLFNFILKWASHFKGAYFWIDQVCINQLDVSERNHQVSIMDRIYRTATQVMVWLGNSSDDSDAFIDRIRGWHTSHNDVIAVDCSCSPCETLNEEIEDESSALVAAFASLSRRPYWSRVWIIQELVLAHSAVVFCGSKFLPLTELYAFFLRDEVRLSDLDNETFHDLMTIKSTHEMESAAGKTFASNLSFQAHVFESMDDMLTFLEDFSVWKCQVAVDKIYGLRGLLPGNARVDIDYNKTLHQVVLDVLRVECRITKTHIKGFAVDFQEQLGVGISREDICKIEEEELGSD